MYLSWFETSRSTHPPKAQSRKTFREMTLQLIQVFITDVNKKKLLVKLKPCISSHMIARTRLLRCFVLQHIVIKTKHLRNLV